MNISINDKISSIPITNQFDAAIGWNNYIISYLDRCENWLDKKLSHVANAIFSSFFSIADQVNFRVDQITNLIQEKFALLHDFNKWLNDNGQGNWYQQLAIFFAKLPARAMRNILQQIYNTIKMVLYIPQHPIKSGFLFTKSLVTLIHELTQPEIWSKIGSEVGGITLARFCITGHPLSLICLGISAALLISGMTMGTLKTILVAERTSRMMAVKQYLLSQAKELPETMLTTFYLALIVNIIQKIKPRVQVEQNEPISITPEWNDPFQPIQKPRVDGGRHWHPWRDPFSPIP